MFAGGVPWAQAAPRRLPLPEVDSAWVFGGAATLFVLYLLYIFLRTPRVDRPRGGAGAAGGAAAGPGAGSPDSGGVDREL